MPRGRKLTLSGFIRYANSYRVDREFVQPYRESTTVNTDVKLSVLIKPEFPDRCVVCSGNAPDSTMGVGDLMIGWFSFFSDIPEGWSSVKVPVHSDCKGPFRLRRWLSRLIYFALAIAIWCLFGGQIEAMFPEIIMRLGSKVVMVLLLLPGMALEMFYPPRFDITVSKYYITFEFSDSRYALEFAECNKEYRRCEEIRSEIRNAA